MAKGFLVDPEAKLKDNTNLSNGESALEVSENKVSAGNGFLGNAKICCARGFRASWVAAVDSVGVLLALHRLP
jgi:hypothetical protein